MMKSTRAMSSTCFSYQEECWCAQFHFNLSFLHSYNHVIKVAQFSKSVKQIKLGVAW